MKLWKKEDTNSQNKVDAFTVGPDRELDAELAPFDVLGSLAHVAMLAHTHLVSATDETALTQSLRKLYEQASAGKLVIEPDVEDIHSQVEMMLTRELGEAGKRLHTGRSRNDQVLLDLKLYFRSRIEDATEAIKLLFDRFIKLADQHKNTLMPGYTHMQVAMPSSFGLWFGAYAEALSDDLLMLQSAYKLANKNPLGSAAGYGSSFPLHRTMTTRLLGFEDLNYNVVYAQMGRGKAERVIAQALANVAATLARFAMDCCLYLGQDFSFISFPAHLTTGSSIMPHKKNPDVFEIMRGRCNLMQGLPNQVALLCANLPTGYHREFQLLKEIIFPAFDTLTNCLQMADYMLQHVSVREGILENEKYRFAFSVEVVNSLVQQGKSFREAYHEVAAQIENNNFEPLQNIHHTHEGSIGNLCLKEIKDAFQQNLAAFNFKKVAQSIESLLAGRVSVD